LVDRYVSGKLDKEEANRLLEVHEKKWGHGSRDAVLGWEISDEASRKVYGEKMARRTRREPDEPSR
jgi:hypothetical protein